MIEQTLKYICDRCQKPERPDQHNKGPSEHVFPQPGKMLRFASFDLCSTCWHEGIRILKKEGYFP